MYDDIKKAVETLRSGGLILYPTDTSWRIGCDATNEKAVERISKLKNAETAYPPLVLIDNPSKLQVYVDEVPDLTWDLIDLSDKPLTIIYQKARSLARNLTGADGSIAIRVTNEAFSRRLCEQFRKPVVAVPATTKGETQPSNFKEISNEIKSTVDYIVHYRQSEQPKQTVSSIIKLGKGNLIEIIRE
ncbi:MAG TPA: L-threonylcarbamoyladenylate synthase [Paludibacter sp.]|nr:L-threonylcarbamoyladenylate synthase [Paludibacter sp.]